MLPMVLVLMMMLLGSLLLMLMVHVKLNSFDLAGTQQGHRCEKSDDGSSHY